MAAIPTNSSPLSQALTRKKSNPIPVILLAVGLIVAVGFAIIGYLESQKTETVVVLTRDVPYGQQITAEDVGVIEVPLHRAEQLAGITNAQAVVGQYAARNLGANDLAQPSMLMAEPPTQPVYPNGEQLTPNMVPVPFSTSTIGPITYRDRVNIGFSDPSGDPGLCDAAKTAAAGEEPTVIAPATGPTTPRPYACRFLSDVRVLWIDGETAYLEVTPYQAHAIWALQAAGLQMWGERYGVTSDPLPSLGRLDIGQVNTEELLAPAPTPQVADEVSTDTAVPGTDTAIPGSRP